MRGLVAIYRPLDPIAFFVLRRPIGTWRPTHQVDARPGAARAWPDLIESNRHPRPVNLIGLKHRPDGHDALATLCGGLDGVLDDLAGSGADIPDEADELEEAD